jgi:hypothetical protein
MRTPFQYTFTPTDRRVYQQWLVGVSAFYGCIGLMILASVLIRAYAGHAGDAMALALQSRDVKCPISIIDRRPACGPQTDRGDSNVFAHAH